MIRTMTIYWKSLLLLACLTAFVTLATGCQNTMQGVGEDIENAGDAIEDSFDEAEDEIDEEF